MFVKDLPEFEPVVSEAGPVDPNVVVEGLPEFVAFSSKSGPAFPASR